MISKWGSPELLSHEFIDCEWIESELFAFRSRRRSAHSIDSYCRLLYRPYSIFNVPLVENCSLTTMRESVGQLIATGTQNFAALIGLFNTDSVEVSASAIHRGSGTVIVSSLSLLGILGLVKGTLKISLGLERCRTAGFNLDSLRGIFGYAAGESALSGKIVDCDAITVTITEERDIIVHKKKRYFDDERTPMVFVGCNCALRSETAVNLGNHEAEASQTLWGPFLFAAISSGVTAWLLLVIKSPWTWVRIMATAGLHSCLMVMVTLPVWYDWQAARPCWHLTKSRWELLNGSMEKNSRLHLLQARVGEGDVLHFQGDTLLLTFGGLRATVLLLTGITSLAYICQYSIVKQATNTEAIIWASCQAGAALVRVLFWIFGPSVYNTGKGAREAQYVLINTTASETITFAELLCACEVGETRLSRTIWEFLQGISLVELLKAVTISEAEDAISTTTHSRVMLTVDFKRILANRLYPGDGGFGNEWRLGFWESADAMEMVPFVLVRVPYSESTRISHCWMQATNKRVPQPGEIIDPCTIFAVSDDGVRLHLRPHENHATQDCSPNCNWDPDKQVDRESPDSWTFLSDRSRLLTEMRTLFSEGKLGLHHQNAFGAVVWVRCGDNSGFRELRYGDLLEGRNCVGNHIASRHRSLSSRIRPLRWKSIMRFAARRPNVFNSAP